MFRIGLGIDSHRYESGRKLILGGVEIPYSMGLMGHSDADVLTHAIMDALLGALSLGSIGDHFPDTDPAYKDADSMKLLAHVYQLIQDKGYEINNIDSVVIAEEPKLKPHMGAIIASLASALSLGIDAVGVKATTAEKMGPEGRLEGMSAHAIVLLKAR